MNRGTLMVLKRLLVTTLGALGLGALAAGPASAQQVPAPDLFDDQVECSMHVPDGMANAALGTNLGDWIKAGNTLYILNPDYDSSINDPDDPRSREFVVGENDLNDDLDVDAVGLNYIIPPKYSNCGAGGATIDHDTDDATAEVLANTVSGAIAKDVATGYSETLTAYLAVRDEDAAVKAANKALSDLLKEETTPDAQITAARVTLAEAQAKQTAAHTALYAVGDGPINSLGIAEWRAKFAVEDAVTAWNTAVDDLTTAETDLNPLDYDKYVPVDSTQLLGLYDDTDNDGMGDTINLKGLRTYANAEGDNASVQNAMTGELTNVDDVDAAVVSAFDAAGNLIDPMELWDHDSDGNTDPVLRREIEAVTDLRMYSDVKGRLDDVTTVVEALEKLQTDNQNALLNAVIEEGLRRAKLEQAHYQAEFNAMVADDADLRDPGQKEPLLENGNANDNFVARYSLKSLYDKYTAAETARDNKGTELDLAFQAREAATTAVATAFTDPQDFYQQLVDRREFLKSGKEAEVTRLAGLTGDDAATEAQTEAATKAVTDAQAALDTATEAQAAFQDLVADDSPVKDLVEELLKSDATGDDGGALVDAIVGAYDGQDAAAARLDALLTEESTTETTDEDGNTVTTTTPESGRIVDIETSIAGLTGEGGDVAVNTAAIAANTTEIGENSDGIIQLDGRVTQNEDDIDSLDGRVTTNEAGIAANTTAIETEATARMEGDAANHTEIMNNRGMIGTNVTNIAANATAIMAEQTARTEADTMLGGRIDTNAGDILTNAGNIVANEMAIGENAGNISTNADGIAANMNAIGANAASIADNRNMIGELSDDLSVVRAGVAASMALAGMPAINGRGISIGVGSFDGESAFAVGFQIQGEMASFKVGVTSGGGATGASAGVGFQF